MGFWKVLKAIDAMMLWPLPQQPSPRAHYWEHFNAERGKESGMSKFKVGDTVWHGGTRRGVVCGNYGHHVGVIFYAYPSEECMVNPNDLSHTPCHAEPAVNPVKFKVGDKVRRVMDGMPHAPIGFEAEIIQDGERGALAYRASNGDICAFFPNKWELIEPAQSGPVRTVTTTRKEIVPGVYGLLRVRDDGSISLSTSDDPEEIRALGRHLIEIADAKDGGK